MRQKILNSTQEMLLAVERYWLTHLQLALARFSATAEDRAALEKSVRQLDELFLLVVVGEFNSGKSAFINALFGEPLLEEGVTPTTTRIHLLKYGQTYEPVAVDNGVDVFTVPATMLEEINIVDTPGTNAIYREHETITKEFIPRADLVLFVTSVDRPFTESERKFLELIRNWGKKVVIVLNKIDILDGPEDITRIRQFIAENARTLLGFTPDIFPVSARQALQAKRQEDPALLDESGLAALERYIIGTLDETERIRLKLLNPLGVAYRLIDKYVGIIDQRLDVLRGDFALLEDVERQFALYREDMMEAFEFRLSDVDNLLYAFETRGMAYFDDTVRLLRIFDLVKKSKLEAEFERQVIADAPQRIEERVDEIIMWLVEENQRQWKAVWDRVEARQEAYEDRLVGEVNANFEYNRARRIETVERVAQQALQAYDKDREAERIADSVQRAVANTALVEASALSLGAAVALLAEALAFDLTGILTAGALAVLGFLVIPAKKRQVKNELHTKITQVREELMQALTQQFEFELDRGLHEIEAAIAPYTRFVRSERQRLEEVRNELTSIRRWLERQAGDIEAL